MKQYEYLGEVIEIPDFEWVAMDADGAIYAYEKKPFIKERCIWGGPSAWHRVESDLDPRNDWQTTLRHISQLKQIENQPQPTEVEQLRARIVVMCGDIESVADDLEHPLPSVARQVAELRKIVADAELFLHQD